MRLLAVCLLFMGARMARQDGARGGSGLSIRLPNTYKEWEKIRHGLKKLAEKRERGLDTFEAIYKNEIDPWDSARPPFGLLRRVLSDGSHMTEEFFCERLLPWLASKALQVEELFKDCDYKLPVSQ